MIGLRFALEELKVDHKPILFVIGCQNYEGICGMSMNNEAYSSYPIEAEVLLMEGCRVFVLAVDADNLLRTCEEGKISKYAGNVITIIHLFHHGY